MKIAILQPSYLPWLGYFEQMAFADLFIHLDDVQYTKGDWRNRNRIKTARGPAWLTVPVRKSPTETLIRNIEIDDSTDWRKNHLNLIRENYRRGRFFDDIYLLLAKQLNKKNRFLPELAVSIVKEISDYLGLSTKTVRSSEYAVTDSDKNGRLIALCKKAGGTLLYDGQAAGGFIDRERFRREGVEVVFQNYRHPEYDQFHPPFLSHLSVVDLLFHHGPESLSIIASGH